MVNLVAGFLKILNSESEPGQISLALCFSMIMGFTPLYSFYNALVLFIVLVVRVNLSSFILGWGIFKGVAYILDPLFHLTGYSILTLQHLQGFWTWAYNIPLLRFARFNNSIVMGSLVISLLLFVPMYIAFNLLIKRYRDHLMVWIEKTRLMQILQTSRIYKVYKGYGSH